MRRLCSIFSYQQVFWVACWDLMAAINTKLNWNLMHRNITAFILVINHNTTIRTHTEQAVSQYLFFRKVQLPFSSFCYWLKDVLHAFVKIIPHPIVACLFEFIGLCRYTSTAILVMKLTLILSINFNLMASCLLSTRCLYDLGKILLL